MPQATQLTEINAFSGGMNNVTAPYLIRRDESVVLTNVNLRRGSMESVPNLIRDRDLSNIYFYQFGNHFLEYGSWRANVVWDNKLYWTDGANAKKILFDGTEMDLGIAAPVTNPDLVGEGTGPHSGNFKYVYTYYDPDTGTESAPSPMSLYVDVDQQNIRVTGFTAPADPNFKIKLYRIGGYLPYFQLVETLQGDTTSYLDELDDTQIDGSELLTLQTGVPPNGIKFFVELNGRLFGAQDNLLYYAALGNPDSWYINDFIPLRGEIKGLAPVPGGLLVMGDNWTNILKGTGPTDFIMRVLSDSIGCREAASINYLDTTAIWLSAHGIVMSDGYAIRQLTADRIEDISGLNPTGSVVFNNIYYMSYKPELYPEDQLFPSNDLYPDSVVGTGGVEQGIISIDFKRGNGYAYKIYSIPLIQYIGLKDGKIAVSHGDPNTYAFDCNEIGFEDCYNWLPCSGFELAFLNTYPTEQLELKYLAEMEYISPLMVDGSTVMLKEYDKVRIIYRGEFECKIYFDNDREVQYYSFASEEELEFSEVLIGIPNEDNKAYSIRFHIRGRGTVKGIQYSYKFREQA